MSHVNTDACNGTNGGHCNAQKPQQADEKHVGIEGVFVWVIRAGGDPVSHDIIAAAKPRLLLAVLSVRVSASSIGPAKISPNSWNPQFVDSQTQDPLVSNSSVLYWV